MTIMKLFISCVLLAVGMMLLPPLTGTGMESMVTRVWLGFGLLVFYSHYLQYSRDLEQEQEKEQQLARAMVRPRPSAARQYSSARK